MLNMEQLFVPFVENTLMSSTIICSTQKVLLMLLLHVSLQNIEELWDFPGGAVVKNPPANAGVTGSSPGPGRSHMSRSN